ncbi:MAG TPA: hypothetical protein VK469_03680 [Candidatus Kapabacteria bacterium]|nr:hypothetical protein [Candidatus Kapabacteria bacterium]
MIVVLSGKTQESHFVVMEVAQAAGEKLTIIPFCIEKVSLSGGLKLLLGNYQWINAYPHPQDKDLDQLVMTLYRHLGIEPRKTFKKEKTKAEVDKGPGFISDLKSKGWVVKKNENDSWEVILKV